LIIDARVRLPQSVRPSKAYSAPSRQTEQYDKILNLSQKMNEGTLERLIAIMREENISHAVMHAETEGGESADALNDCLGEVLAQHPTLFKGIGTVDVLDRTPGEIHRQTGRVAAAGMIGVAIQCAFVGLDIDDRRLYPMYAKAEEHGLIIFLHTGINYSRMHPMRHERPEIVDQIACDFPDLKIVAGHAGWPWATEFAAVARRHPTVYLEFGALAPKYVAKPGTGWDALFGMMPNVLRNQVLYGSDWPMMQPRRALAEWRDAGLGEATIQALFHDNAARLFKFES